MKSGIIVGTGRAGTFLHRGAFAKAGAEIVAFVDIDDEAACAAAKAYQVPNAYSDLDEALSKHKVDFVSVCTSASSHLDVARKAIAAGCHVLVEKPIASTLAEAEEMVGLAKEMGVTLCVVHNHKYFPGIAKALELVASGKIGDVIHVDRQMTFLKEKIRMMEPGHWAHAIPGGRLFEANPHNLYLVRGFSGPLRLKCISAKKTSDLWPHAPIDSFTASLESDTCTAQITMCATLETSPHYTRHGTNCLQITGTRETLFLTYHHCYFYDSLRKGQLGLPKPIADSIDACPSQDLPYNDGTNSGHRYFIERFISFLEGRLAEPPTSMEEALEVQRLNQEMGMAVEDAMRMTGPA